MSSGRKRRSKIKQKRILVVRTDRVGDTVMITPMVRELKKTFPGSFIATLTHYRTRDILLNNPYVEEAMADDLHKTTFWKTVKKIRRRKFTHALLVMPTERAAYQLFFAGIPRRIGVGRKLYEVITFMGSVSRNKYIPLRNEADYCMDLARKIGVRTNNLKKEIFITDSERKRAGDILKSYRVDEKDLKIFLHTGSGGSSPNWSEKRYLELVKEIKERLQGKFKLILTAKEMSEEFKSDVKQICPALDITSELGRLRELIGLISFADIFISSSTGPAHIADALDKHCVVIHCHRAMNSAKLWGMLNDKSANLEVPAGFCDNNCSADKEVCKIENGLLPAEVAEEVVKFAGLIQDNKNVN